jgi:hypothetical protein
MLFGTIGNAAYGITCTIISHVITFVGLGCFGNFKNNSSQIFGTMSVPQMSFPRTMLPQMTFPRIDGCNAGHDSPAQALGSSHT